MLAPTIVVFSGGAALELGLVGGPVVIKAGPVGVSSGAQGAVLGWGTGQSAQAVAQTRAVTAALTREKVREMIANGLRKEWVEGQLKSYVQRMAQGVGGAARPNTQVLARKELMEKVLSLWPK
jgi:hypothetical protein